MCVSVHIYIYIYIERERERELSTLGYFMPETFLFYFFYVRYGYYLCRHLYISFFFFFFSGMPTLVPLFYTESFFFLCRPLKLIVWETLIVLIKNYNSYKRKFIVNRKFLIVMLFFNHYKRFKKNYIYVNTICFSDIFYMYLIDWGLHLCCQFQYLHFQRNRIYLEIWLISECCIGHQCLTILFLMLRGSLSSLVVDSLNVFFGFSLFTSVLIWFFSSSSLIGSRLLGDECVSLSLIIFRRTDWRSMWPLFCQRFCIF